MKMTSKLSKEDVFLRQEASFWQEKAEKQAKSTKNRPDISKIMPFPLKKHRKVRTFFAF
tara:strand:- start:907 stop:1083 length:177 start_codon:yes stop_codon:yes gene_type:complete